MADRYIHDVIAIGRQKRYVFTGFIVKHVLKVINTDICYDEYPLNTILLTRFESYVLNYINHYVRSPL